MKLSVGFKRAVREDLNFLLTLRKSSMTEHLNKAGLNYTDEDHVARINEYFEDSFIITNHNENIGLVKLGVFSNRIHIRQFQILPHFQGLGIGSYVLDVVKKKANKLNLPITLYVLFDNPAKHLYIRHGFYVEEQLTKEYKMRWDNLSP